MAFDNVEQIREKFIKDGWNKNVSFDELSLEEAKRKGYLFAIDEIVKGKKYFKMKVSENIYDNKGKIVLFDIRPIMT